MWMHRSMSHRCDNHPSKNCLKPRNFSRCPLWSSIPTARCKPRFLQLETLPQYVSHKALAQERSSTQSTTKKKEGGILISIKVLSYIQAYTWYLRENFYGYQNPPFFLFGCGLCARPLLCESLV